jgi:AcrR family transcriptional regulator
MAGTLAHLARALDPGTALPADDAVGERILDAALTLVAASGARHLTMDDVARRAKVGRMTVYRRFGDKPGLLDALSGREVRRCLAAMDGFPRPGQPIAEQIADAFVIGQRLLHEHPLLSRLSRIEPESLLHSLVDDDSAIFGLLRAFVADRLRAAQAGLIGDHDADQTAEVLVRVMVSFALIPGTVLPVDDDARAREAALRLLAPIVGAAPR